MRLKKKILEKILDVLETSTWGMTIEEIAKETGYHRNTISKYMALLNDVGFVFSRTIGKYTFWLPRNIYIYRKTNVAKQFFQDICIAFNEVVPEDCKVDWVKIGEKVGMSTVKRSLKSIKHQRTVSFKELGKVFKAFLGIFIPTIIPGLRYKVSEFDYDDDNIVVQVSGIQFMEGEEFEIACSFITGYIVGIFKGLQTSVRNVITRKSNQANNGFCEVQIFFNELVGELIGKIRKVFS